MVNLPLWMFDMERNAHRLFNSLPKGFDEDKTGLDNELLDL